MASLKKQKGDFLLESLIGMVLMAVIGMGVVAVTGKVSLGQKDMNVQTVVINQMRQALMQNGVENADICENAPSVVLPSGEQVVIEMQGCAAGVSAETVATITDPNSAVIAQSVMIPQPVVLKAQSTAFSGDIVVGGTWQ